ncbi:hypothetical protein [Amycolatopsis granulosa]|nr:hypothetical protein [Amycolatopsis granulosa]
MLALRAGLGLVVIALMLRSDPSQPSVVTVPSAAVQLVVLPSVS